MYDHNPYDQLSLDLLVWWLEKIQTYSPNGGENMAIFYGIESLKKTQNQNKQKTTSRGKVRFLEWDSVSQTIWVIWLAYTYKVKIVDLARKIQAAKPWWNHQYLDPQLPVCGGLFPKLFFWGQIQWLFLVPLKGGIGSI